MKSAVLLPPTGDSYRHVAGLPVIQRAALSAVRAGFSPVLALGGDRPERLRALFDADERTRGVAIVDGDSALPAGGTVALIPADCVVTPETLLCVARADGVEQPVLFPSSSGDGHGILLAPAASAAAVVSANGHGAAAGAARVRGASDGELCVRVRDAHSARRAERWLLKNLRAATWSSDGPLARFDRALSTRLSRRLVRTRVRPNQITVFGTLVGLLAAWSFAQGTYAAGIAGALLFWVAVVIDGCDGEVARLKFLDSRFGHAFDVATDNLVHVAIFIGLGMGQYRTGSLPASPFLTVLFLGGFACAGLATYVCLLRDPPLAGGRPRSRKGRLRLRLLGVFELVMNRDFAYLLLVLALAGHLAWFFKGAAFGTYAYAAGLAFVYWGLRESGDPLAP